MTRLKALVDYVYQHDAAGLVVLALVKPSHYNQREDFEEALADPLLALMSKNIPCTVALVANEPIEGVVGVPVVTLGLYPSLDDVEKEDAGLADLERGYQ